MIYMLRSAYPKEITYFPIIHHKKYFRNNKKLCIKCVVIRHFCNEWHYTKLHRSREDKIKLQHKYLFHHLWWTGIRWVNWLSLATGPTIVASLALAVGSIGHSTGLVGRSLLLKKKYIDEHITARSSCLHIHFKGIKDRGKDSLISTG